MPQSCSWQNADTNIGSAQPLLAVSVSQLLATLAPACACTGAYFLLFVALRRRFPQKYQLRARTKVLHVHERSPELPGGLLDWIVPFLRIPDTHALSTGNIDSYLFLRFLRLAAVSSFAGWLLCMPLLTAVNATGGSASGQIMDAVNLANIKGSYWRYFAHVACAYAFFGYMIVCITHETNFCIRLRHALLVSPPGADRRCNRTVLFADVPSEFLNDAHLRDLLGEHIRQVWYITDTRALEKKTKERDTVAMRLENAETKLCKLVHRAKLGAGSGQWYWATEPGPSFCQTVRGTSYSANSAAMWVDSKCRPSFRSPPFVGKRSDTIKWCRERLGELGPEISKEQAAHASAEPKKLNSVFIEFDSVREAQTACQNIVHHHPLRLSLRRAGIPPTQVIWSNAALRWHSRVLRGLVAKTIIVLLICFWSAPVGVIGAISNIQNLSHCIPALGFINRLPSKLIGVVTGLLPAALLAVLINVLPATLQKIARFSGAVSKIEVEVATQDYYFAFQVIQVFLVATVGSSAAAVAGQLLENPKNLPDTLAKTIPTASGFYLAYFALQGLTVSSSLVLGLKDLVVSLAIGKLCANTPRKMFERRNTLIKVSWGSVYPVYMNLLVIATCYACIAPLVLLFASAGLWLFYHAYRYNIFFVYESDTDTRGVLHVRAMNRLFVGIYLGEICLASLVFLKLTKLSALGPFTLAVLLLLITAVYHIQFSRSIRPLIHHLPRSLSKTPCSLARVAGTRHTTADLKEKSMTGTHKSTRSTKIRKFKRLLKRLLTPNVHLSYDQMRHFVAKHTQQTDCSNGWRTDTDTFLHPSVTSQSPVLWIPRDCAGASGEEVRKTEQYVPMTNSAAYFDHDGQIIWDELSVPDDVRARARL